MLETIRQVGDSLLAEIEREKTRRGVFDIVLLFPLGSQFDHLIRIALEQIGVFCLVCDPASLTADDVRRLKPRGIVLSGGPASVYAERVAFDRAIFQLGIPVLGICLGFQLWAQAIKACVMPASKREFGTHQLRLVESSELFSGCPKDSLPVLQSHGDYVAEDRDRLTILGSTENCQVAAAQAGHLYGVQFHPEVTETVHGLIILQNFCFTICGIARGQSEAMLERKRREVDEAVRGKTVLLALSGGSDSSVVAYLLADAKARGVPVQVHAVYLRGIDRPDDEANVQRFFGGQDWINLCVLDGTEYFLRELRGTADMAEKRLAVRRVYRELIESHATAVGADLIGQGTLYTDISESGLGYSVGQQVRKDCIKLHHNVGLAFSLPEFAPLADLVKDTARNLGTMLGVPTELLRRHPFPGPGLVVRIEDEVNATTLAIARQADQIYLEELQRAGLYQSIWQAGVTLTQSVHTCTKGDEAVSGLLLVYWAVTSVNGFTAQAADLPFAFQTHLAKRFTNEIRLIGAVAYRISDKPPSTIEWG